jgi:DNA-binding HxlR family transcriptional regulator
MSDCAQLKKTLSILGDKWSAIILWSLAEGAQRFGDLQKHTEGINPRTLTQRLQMLEREGLLHREEFREYPPRTEYSLTVKGHDVQPVLREMMRWSKKHSQSC